MRIKYVGKSPGVTYYVGRMLPGEVREVPDEIGEMLLKGWFEKTEDKPLLPMVIKIKKNGCTKCPKEGE